MLLCRFGHLWDHVAHLGGRGWQKDDNVWQVGGHSLKLLKPRKLIFEIPRFSCSPLCFLSSSCTFSFAQLLLVSKPTWFNILCITADLSMKTFFNFFFFTFCHFFGKWHGEQRTLFKKDPAVLINTLQCDVKLIDSNSLDLGVQMGEKYLNDEPVSNF